jgi:hypothetical protein
MPRSRRIWWASAGVALAATVTTGAVMSDEMGSAKLVIGGSW